MERPRLVFTCGIAALVIAVSGCPLGGPTGPKDQEPAPPFQGPVDPSFEAASGEWHPVFALGTSLTFAGSSNVVITTGTGFLPSSGIRYARMNGYNNVQGTIPPTSLYQDNVDLTRSTTMSFDYFFSGTAGQGGGKATVQILFTSNGTQTLWSRTIDATSLLPLEKKGETVTLPATTSAGRLTVSFVILGGTVPPNNITQTSVTFGIDNVVVK